MKTMANTAAGTGQHQIMGGLALAGAVCYLITGIILIITGDESHSVANAFGLLWALGCICGLLGIAALGATGSGILGRVALAVALGAYALAAVDALLITIGLYPVEGSPLFAISRLGTLVGMLLVGIAALVARRWEGWRRFSPFAVLLALPISIVFAMATGIGSIVIFIGLAWAVIGYAILSTPTR